MKPKTHIQKKQNDFFNKKILPIDIILFFRQLSTLILAGIPITQAIHILGQNPEQTRLLLILNTLKENIASGKELAVGLRKFPRHFDEMTCSLIQAGEKSGTLDTMLDRIAQHKEKVAHLKSSIKQALFYPCMVLIVAVIVTLVMLTFIVPRFAELFQTMHGTLPAFTRGVIFLATIVRHSAGIFVLLLIAGWLLFFHAKKSPRGRKNIDGFILTLPIIGTPIKKIILTRFARNLATLLAAGIPITEALRTMTHSTGNSIYAHSIQKLAINISIGKQLHFAMQTDKLFPALMLQMVQVGEESGTLEKMLEKTAEFYEADINQFIANLERLLEPMIITILGVLIGGLVIAMYLPIFRLGTVI